MYGSSRISKLEFWKSEFCKSKFSKSASVNLSSVIQSSGSQRSGNQDSRKQGSGNQGSENRNSINQSSVNADCKPQSLGKPENIAPKFLVYVLGESFHNFITIYESILERYGMMDKAALCLPECYLRQPYLFTRLCLRKLGLIIHKLLLLWRDCWMLWRWRLISTPYHLGPDVVLPFLVIDWAHARAWDLADSTSHVILSFIPEPTN